MILYAKDVAQCCKDECRELAKKLPAPPRLTIFMVGNDEASQVYVRGKERDFLECGFFCETVHLPDTISQEELIEHIVVEGDKPEVNGIIVQCPLPKHINADKVFQYIPPHKDVDGMGQSSKFSPCTPSGILYLMDAYNINPSGKHCVIVGRSNLVGRPLAKMLLDRNATITVCHSYTESLQKHCKSADILISAVGEANFITEDMVKKGAVVIDVGTNRINGKLCGDVCFDEVSKIAYAITPVPGGVGLMTRAMLVRNTYLAAELEVL